MDKKVTTSFDDKLKQALEFDPRQEKEEDFDEQSQCAIIHMKKAPNKGT